jgi:hypothetical protein
MDSSLAVRRRALAIVYRRYLDADQAWNEAVRGVMSWFPPSARPHRMTLGSPGSPIRRLYDRRQQAISQLETALLKFRVARMRLAAQQGSTGSEASPRPRRLPR